MVGRGMALSRSKGDADIVKDAVGVCSSGACDRSREFEWKGRAAEVEMCPPRGEDRKAGKGWMQREPRGAFFVAWDTGHGGGGLTKKQGGCK